MNDAACEWKSLKIVAVPEATTASVWKRSINRFIGQMMHTLGIATARTVIRLSKPVAPAAPTAPVALRVNAACLHIAAHTTAKFRQICHPTSATVRVALLSLCCEYCQFDVRQIRALWQVNAVAHSEIAHPPDP